jgi:hypothetical protein
MTAEPVTPEPAKLVLKIGGVWVDGVLSIDIESLLEEGDTTADAATARTRSWVIKDGRCSMELLEDATDTGQIAIQTDYNTPGTSVYVLTRGSKTFTFTAFPSSIKETGGPADLQKISVTLSVTGGVATGP